MKKRTIRAGKTEETLVQGKSHDNLQGKIVHLQIVDTDMHLIQENFMETELREFKNLRALELVNCQFNTFQPVELSEWLEHLSLEGNNITEIDKVKFSSQPLPGAFCCPLKRINLSLNRFTKFPYSSL
jgi:Leucine-rich repeat (LRR) protein